jgi:hypothetical protein
MDDVGRQGASVEFKGKGTGFVVETIGQGARLCKRGLYTGHRYTYHCRPWSSRALKRRPVRLRTHFMTTACRATIGVTLGPGT